MRAADGTACAQESDASGGWTVVRHWSREFGCRVRYFEAGSIHSSPLEARARSADWGVRGRVAT